MRHPIQSEKYGNAKSHMSTGFVPYFKDQNSAESGVAPAPGWVGGGGHRCNINFSNGQSIGIVLYGMCSHSLYIKGEN